MTTGHGPTLIRHADQPYCTKPGLHSHNLHRRATEQPKAPRSLRTLRIALLIFGLCAIGYYCYSLANQYVYQRYENWAFDQQIAGRRAVTFADYIREQTPFGFVTGASSRAAVNLEPAPTPTQPALPQQGSILGRVAISRLNLSAIVREGVDPGTLKIAVGHVPSTALPGQAGNFAIAAHRDTLFRALKDIRDGDTVTFESAAGSYNYQVIGTKIVKPSDVSVLDPQGDQKLLTMITCYPFYYVGSAPKRFIVQAKLVDTGAPASADVAAEPVPAVATQTHVLRSKTAVATRKHPAAKPKKKQGLYHKLAHAL